MMNNFLKEFSQKKTRVQPKYVKVTHGMLFCCAGKAARVIKRGMAEIKLYRCQVFFF